MVEPLPDQSGFAVMAIKPFWRYCIVPADMSPSVPAIPFYTRKGAEERAREMSRSGSMFQPILLFAKRRWRWREIDPDPLAFFMPAINVTPQEQSTSEER